MRLLYNRVLIDPDPGSTMLRGIHVPQEVPPDKGTVLACGPDAYDIQPGDRVAFHHFAGTTLSIHGQKVKLVDDTEVLLNFDQEDEDGPAD